MLGGASEYLTLHAAQSGVMVVDTIGSQIDTVLAVYYPAPLRSLSTNLVACDNNGAPDGIRSLVRFAATAGLDYWVFVDGVNAAQGPISLNWKMGEAPLPLPSPPTTPAPRAMRSQRSGRVRPPAGSRTGAARNKRISSSRR